MPKQQKKMAVTLKEEPIRRLTIGIIGLFAIPVVIIAAGISVIGIPFI